MQVFGFRSTLLIFVIQLSVTEIPPAFGAPALLAQFEQRSTFWSDSPTVQVGFVLGLYDQYATESIMIGSSHGPDQRLAPTQYWSPGQTGLLEFNRLNDPNFERFSLAATDGTDGNFVIFSNWDAYSFGGAGGKESRLFDTSADLVGHTLDSVILEVNEVDFDSNGLLGPEWSWTIQYNFYGSTIVPEPTSVVLGAVVLCFVLGNQRF